MTSGLVKPGRYRRSGGSCSRIALVAAGCRARRRFILNGPQVTAQAERAAWARRAQIGILRGCCLALALLAAALPARAQTRPSSRDIVDGYASVMVDVLPDVSAGSGRQSATELRTRLFVERHENIGQHLRLNLAGYVEGLVADRGAIGGSGATTAATIKPTDLSAEWRAAHFDVRAGVSRVVWGRLDEFQPGDVVNPIDTTRFLLEGRSEARLAVPMVRTRIFLPASIVLEGLVVPVFRSGRSDQLDEETSPFNLGALPEAFCPGGPAGCVTLLQVRLEPEIGWRQMQGGARVTGSVGRVDVGASVYRGFKPFGTLTLGPPLPTFAPGIPVHNLFETFRYKPGT